MYLIIITCMQLCNLAVFGFQYNAIRKSPDKVRGGFVFPLAKISLALRFTFITLPLFCVRQERFSLCLVIRGCSWRPLCFKLHVQWPLRVGAHDWEPRHDPPKGVWTNWPGEILKTETFEMQFSVIWSSNFCGNSGNFAEFGNLII